MTRYTGIAAVGLLLCGCDGSDGSHECTVGTTRCSGNAAERCVATFGGTMWTGEACPSPQVCRVELLPDWGPVSARCFEPNHYCEPLGARMCLFLDNHQMLYECVERPSDRTWQWSLTYCETLVPAQICTVSDAGVYGCYTLTKNCEPLFATRCEGNDLLTCTPHTSTTSVWQWDSTSCPSLMPPYVCRVGPTGGSACVPP
jgi:hypothetical protein